MHTIESPGPDGPCADGGHPALAFCNAGTFADYRDFLAWSADLGLIDCALTLELSAEADRHRAQASHVVHEVRTLQAAIRLAVTDPSDTAGYQRITRMAHQAYADAVLLPGTPARWELGRALETPLYAVALAAVDLLTELDLRTVRQCSVAGCSALAVEDARHRCAEELGGRAGVADRQAYATVARAIA